MGRLHHIGPDFLLAVLQVDPVQLGTGRHAVCRRAVIQLEYIINDFRLFLIKSAQLGPLLEKHLDFLFRNRLLPFHMNAKEPHHSLGGPGGKKHQRFAHRSHYNHGPGHKAGRLLRNGNGNPFRRQLPDNQGKISHQHHDSHHAHHLGIRRQRREFRQLLTQRPRQGRSGKHTGNDADGGNAYLDGRKKLLLPLCQTQGIAGALIPFINHFLELRLPRSHNGDFCQRTDPVGQDQ